MLCDKASHPWKAVNFGGTVFINSGSTMANTGNSAGSLMPTFSCVSSFVTTAPGSVSEPVPAVVVIATMGSGLFSIVFHFPVPD
jgi:hypothetical protein